MWGNVYLILVSENKLSHPVKKIKRCSQSQRLKRSRIESINSISPVHGNIFLYFSIVSNISTKNVYYPCNSGKWQTARLPFRDWLSSQPCSRSYSLLSPSSTLALPGFQGDIFHTQHSLPQLLTGTPDLPRDKVSERWWERKARVHQSNLHPSSGTALLWASSLPYPPM